MQCPYNRPGPRPQDPMTYSAVDPSSKLIPLQLQRPGIFLTLQLSPRTHITHHIKYIKQIPQLRMRVHICFPLASESLTPLAPWYLTLHLIQCMVLLLLSILTGMNIKVLLICLTVLLPENLVGENPFIDIFDWRGEGEDTDVHTNIQTCVQAIEQNRLQNNRRHMYNRR